MSQISSVTVEKEVKVGAQVNKGQILGKFLFGGSDIILLFQKEAGFELNVNFDKGQNEYDHLLMGKDYGKMKGF